jgi:hypothetical protein
MREGKQDDGGGEPAPVGRISRNVPRASLHRIDAGRIHNRTRRAGEIVIIERGLETVGSALQSCTPVSRRGRGVREVAAGATRNGTTPAMRGGEIPGAARPPALDPCDIISDHESTLCCVQNSFFCLF